MITIRRQMTADALRNIEPLSVLFFVGEEYAHRFLIDPPTSGAFTGCTVEARFIRPDGQNVAPAGELVDGSASVVLTPACYGAAGRAKLFIYIVSENETVCAYACTMLVTQTVGPNGTAGDGSPIIEAYGNALLTGSLTLGVGTEGEVTLTAAQLTALLALIAEEEPEEEPAEEPAEEEPAEEEDP